MTSLRGVGDLSVWGDRTSLACYQEGRAVVLFLAGRLQQLDVRLSVFVGSCQLEGAVSKICPLQQTNGDTIVSSPLQGPEIGRQDGHEEESVASLRGLEE